MSAPWEIPQNWAWADVGDFANVIGGGTPATNDAGNFAEPGLPWITPADLSGFKGTYISRGRRCLSETGLTSCGARMLPAGTVLMSSRAPIGYVAIAENPLCTNQGFKSFVLPHDIDSKYMFYFVQRGRFLIDALAGGTTFKEISGANSARIPFPIAPLAEQRRIAAEIEKQFTRLDAAEAALKSTQAKLRRYTSACIREAYAQSFPTKPLRELAFIKGGLTMHTDRTDIGHCVAVPYLRVANVQRGFLDVKVIKNIMATPEEVDELALQPGDVLFTEGGDRDKLGRGWVWQGEINRCIHQNHVFRARLNGPVLPKWVSYYANEIGQHYFHREGKQTTNLASINITKLGSLPIPTPPLAVQEQLLSQIEAQTSASRHLTDELTRARTHGARLRQAILAKAFSGQLVPQDPNDEPASVLLERIRAERAAAPISRHNGQPARSRTPVCALESK